MPFGRRFYLALVFAVAAAGAFPFAPSARAQSREAVVYHKVEGHLRIGNVSASNVRVRLLREDQQRTIAETFSRSGGEFEFGYLREGTYIVATDESKELEATSTLVRVQPWPRDKPIVVYVNVSLTRKAPTPAAAPGVVAADVDLSVPKEALKHYRAGMKALDEGKDERALAEFGEAVRAYPNYYAARVELGRMLRELKRFAEAEEALRPLLEIAPKHPEVWLRHAVVLLDLARRDEAAGELKQAIALDETDWAAHYYLGWALMETDTDKAEPHLARALELDEQKAVRAHLALARIADSRGQRLQAIEHLEAYVAVAPDSADAPGARQLAERLRNSKP